MTCLKQFMLEQEKVGKFIGVLTGGYRPESIFGDQFISDYLTVIEIAIGDDYNAISYFVFDCEWGKDGTIYNTGQLYDSIKGKK